MADDAALLESGRYRLLRLLGAGGMATVHEAWDARLEVKRAIKLLDPALLARARIRARFEAEARTMARLAHRNIVTVHDVGVDDGRAFIVMELVEGGSLADRLESYGPIPPRLACEWVAAVLEALDTAHAAGVVHRDIKPANILLTADGVPKLGDFGIAMLSADEARSTTRTGMTLGTLAYMPPEQKADTKSVGPAADLYATGATLYALVSGHEPHDLFAAEVKADALRGLAPALVEVIDRATRYRPEDRYGSASEMRGAVLGALSRLPMSFDASALQAPPPAAPRPVDGVDSFGDQALSDVFPRTTPGDGLAPASRTWAETAYAPPSVAPPSAAPVPASVAPVPAAVAPPARRRPVGIPLLAAAVGLAVAAGAWAWWPEPAPVAPAPAPVVVAQPTPDAVAPPAPVVVAAEPAAVAPVRVPPAPAPKPRAEPVAPPPAPVVTPVEIPVEAAPAPPAPAPPPGAPARFSSTVPADVLVDGDAVGTTPFAGEIPIGKHRITIRPADGRPAFVRTFSFTAGARVTYCHDFDAGAPCR